MANAVKFRAPGAALALGLAALAALAGCAQAVQVDVEIVNPCNQEAIQAVDYLKLEPRGEGIDSLALTAIDKVEDGSAKPVTIPLTTDFQLVVTGHKDDYNNPPAAIGVSARMDLKGAKTNVAIRVPFALVDSFYKTTKLDDHSCSELQIARYGATATYLPKLDKVLIVGGATLKDNTIEFKRTIELYDPGTGEFKPVAELKTGGARAFHTATLLADGRVLVAGGQALVQLTRESLKSALIIDPTDPANVTISDGIIMRRARSGHTAAKLTDGRVVLIGGRQLNAAATKPQDHTYLAGIEIFDPDKGLFVVPGDGSGSAAVELSAARYGHSATLLKTGRDILVAGGFNETGPVRSLEVIHLEGDMVSLVRTSSTITTSVGPIFHAAALAQDGRVLLSGGYDEIADAEPSGGMPQNASPNVEMWEFRDANRDLILTCNAAMTTGRGYHSVSMVGRRAILIGGRTPTGAPTASAEVAALTTGANCFAATPTTRDMSDARAEHTAVTLGSGEVLIIGGRQQQQGDPFGTSLASAEVFSPAREP